MNINGLKIELEKISSSPHLARFLVKDERGLPFGLIEKFKDDKFTTNPWKAFQGIGMSCKYIGAFYREDGYKDAAIKAVVNSCK